MSSTEEQSAKHVPTTQPRAGVVAKLEVFRSKKFYWILGTLAVVGVSLSLYYMIYVASQQSYYNDRAFRLLSSMADKLNLDLEIVRNVLAAAANKNSLDSANDYVERFLHGTLEPGDFVITGLSNVNPETPSSHNGGLTLFPPQRAGSPIILVDYREPSTSEPEMPCAGSVSKKSSGGAATSSAGALQIVICGSVDLANLVRPSFQQLEQDFFQDVLIADSSGEVLYQHANGGTRIENLSRLVPSAVSDKTAKSDTQSANDKKQATQSFANISHYSNVQRVELAGSAFQLFIEPIPVSLRTQSGEQRILVLCGLRSVKSAESQALMLPHTYLIWAILMILTAFTLAWPFLKLVYMSPKERLHTRHLFYLLLSITTATACATLIALNLAHKLTSANSAEMEIQRLAVRLNINFTDELRNGLDTLRDLSSDPGLLSITSATSPCDEPVQKIQWNEAQFLQKHKDLASKLKTPFFRYFFIADEKGCQRLKLTVNPESTPAVNVSREPYFHPIVDKEFSHLTGRAGSDPPYDFRMEPVFSSNTGEFLVVLAEPFVNDKLRVRALAIRPESLVNPVLPTGYGFAIIDNSGRVLFDSVSARNLTEDFTKESRADPALLAMLDQGTTGTVDTLYLGSLKKMFATPVSGLSDPRLTLIVYKDSAYFATLNTASMVVVVVLLSIYALPFWIVVVVHFFRRSDYPLKGMWPDCDFRQAYFRIFVANGFLSAVFFLRYIAYTPKAIFINLCVLGTVAVLYALLELRQEYFQLLGRAVLIATLLYLAGWTVMTLYAMVFAIIILIPEPLLQKHSVAGRLSLKATYTLFISSLLLVLVVVPTCAFFKVSYEYVQRLFLQQQQLDLAEMLSRRRSSIEAYYQHLDPEKPEELSQFRRNREQLYWDRYDGEFLNCRPTASDKPLTLPLQWNFTDDLILWSTDQFPDNVLSARLRRLASSSITPPDLSWSLGGAVNCPQVTAAKSIWLTSPPGSTQPSNNDPVDHIQIVSPYPSWSALAWRVRLFLALAVIGIALWVHFVPSRMFLLDVPELPPLDKWRPRKDSTFVPQNLLILGHPKSGKRLTVKLLQGVKIMDFAQLATINEWKIGLSSPDIVALNHFELGIDDPDINLNKLKLVEELIYVRHRRVIILSTVDPLFYLSQGVPAAVASGKDQTIPIQLLDRWAAVLASFRKMTIEDITEKGFQNVVSSLRRRRSDDEFRIFINNVIRECNHTAQLRKIGAVILRAHRKDNGLSRDVLVQELLDRADAYYRVLWSTCTENERVVLYQLAADGWANFKNEAAINQLKRRKLVNLSYGLRIMNESFRQFVLHSQYRVEVEAWEREEEQSVWKSLKLSLGVLAIVAAAWLFYSQEQFFNSLVGYVSAFGAAAAVLVKWIGDLRSGGKSTESARP